MSVYRFVTKDTVEEDVLERAKRKMILEYAIIHQMDTSGTQIDRSRAAAPRAELNEGDLTAILKFGAAQLFQSTADQSKLESMDLDEIMGQGEMYESEVLPGAGSNLGGEDFLQAFAAVQDVKADASSWDDIIPLAFRQQVAQDLVKQQEQEAASHAAADPPLSGADASLEQAKSQAPPTKPTKKGRSHVERSLDLSERDVRALIRSLQTFGDIRSRYEDIVQHAKCEGKNRAIVLQTVDELVALCEKAIREKQDLISSKRKAGEEVSASLRNKAVLLEFGKVGGINAETTVNRVEHLRTLHEGEMPSEVRQQRRLADSPAQIWQSCPTP